jgi:hypothetical protein
MMYAGCPVEAYVRLVLVHPLVITTIAILNRMLHFILQFAPLLNIKRIHSISLSTTRIHRQNAVPLRQYCCNAKHLDQN